MKNLINAILDRREDISSINVYLDKEGNVHITILPAEPNTKTITYHADDGRVWAHTLTEEKPEKKPKTYLEDLLEKYPNFQKLDGREIPIICPNRIGLRNTPNCGDGLHNCGECWNQLMEE